MSKLKGYRVMLGLTQKNMADKLGISLQSYNNKETGKTPFTDRERLIIREQVREIKPDITILQLERSKHGTSLHGRTERAIYNARHYS